MNANETVKNELLFSMPTGFAKHGTKNKIIRNFKMASTEHQTTPETFWAGGLVSHRSHTNEASRVFCANLLRVAALNPVTPKCLCTSYIST